ncbi:MAG: hypothetical protein U0871_22105 [Gemmataceae bacterium]
MTPLPAPKALDAFYLDARSRLLDLAATLDRIDRGVDAAAARSDPRLARLRAGVEQLLAAGPGGRAEAVQRLFSLDYDPAWERPTPR